MHHASRRLHDLIPISIVNLDIEAISRDYVTRINETFQFESEWYGILPVT